MEEDKPAKERFNLMIAHRLVGADEVSIKVERVISAPITIGE